jgi:hypothetical protein
VPEIKAGFEVVVDNEKQNNEAKQIRHHNILQHLRRERGENRDDPLLPTVFTGEVIDNADRHINTHSHDLAVQRRVNVAGDTSQSREFITKPFNNNKRRA